MAVPIPSPILDSVLKQLDSLGQSSELNWALHTQLQKLRSNLELIGDVLEEVELMGFLFPDVCRQWVRDLEDVLYAADDLLDEALTCSIPPKGQVGKVRLTMSNLSFFQVTLPHQLKSKVNKKVEKIVERWCEYNLIVEPTTSTTSSSTSSAAAGTTTAGRNGDQKKVRVARKGIMRYEYDPENASNHDVIRITEQLKVQNQVRDKLLDDADNKIVWVVGGPGMGKTTVCRTLYDDMQVEQRFPIRLWVRLDGPDSYIPALKKIVKKVASQVPPVCKQHKKEQEPVGMDDEEEEGWLIMKIKRLLCGRRFLLVLDNYPPLPWSFPDKEDSECSIVIPDTFAAKLRCLLAEEKSQGRTAGNKILITRLHGDMFVWKCPYQDASWQINSLSEKDGLSLFYHTTLGQVRPETTWQKSLGKEIVRNCEGNPALIRCIGTFLKGVDDEASWKKFASEYRYPNERYYHRIAELYYSFRKSLHFVGHSYLLSRGGLFKYQDLLSQVAATGLPEISGRMEKLFRRAILLERKSDDLWDEESSYKLIPCLKLDLLDDPLHQGRATTRFEAIYEPPASPSSTPRDDHLQDDVLTSSSLTKDSRSFVSLGDDSNMRMPEPELEAFVSRFRSLRVLDLSSTGIQKLPPSISRLSHLRYLDLSRNDFRELPRSICRLKKLQTLKLVYCDKLVKLPRNMHRLAHSLEIIRLDMCFHLTGMPRAMSRLTGLKTLDRFVVSGERGGLGYLKNLKKLGGRLSLELPIWWNDAAADAHKADLNGKTDITELQVKWPGVGQDDVTRDNVDGVSNGHYEVLQRLKPNSALKKLSITNFGGTEFPTWITWSQLSEISISKCKRCQSLPPFHKMPNLKSLTLTSMDVEYIQYEYPNPHKKFFPSLEKLRIGKMCNLKGWYVDWGSRGLSKFRKLDFVKIWKCPNLATLPRFSDINELILQDVPEKLFESIHRQCFEEVPEKLFESIHRQCFEEVRINSIQNLTSLPNQFIGLITKTLIIEDCSKLEMLGASDQGNKSQNVSQRLRRLEFKGSKDIKLVLPKGLQHLSNLTELKISKDIEDLRSIHKGEGEGEDIVMPWEGLQKLENLEIRGFKKLQALPNGLQNLSSLRKLAVVDCPAMKHMSSTLKKLTNLEKLEISTCSEDVDCLHGMDEEDGMPWKAIGSLDKLIIRGFKELKSLPKSLQNLRYIWELEIIQCPALVKVDCVYDGDETENRTIWKELRVASLKIEGCGKLEALPEGLQHPKSLCKLLVTDCKALKNVPKWKAKDMEYLCFLKIKACPQFSKEIKQRIKNYSFHKKDSLQLLEQGSSNDDIPFYMKPYLEIFYE